MRFLPINQFQKPPIACQFISLSSSLSPPTPLPPLTTLALLCRVLIMVTANLCLRHNAICHLQCRVQFNWLLTKRASAQETRFLIIIINLLPERVATAKVRRRGSREVWQPGWQLEFFWACIAIKLATSEGKVLRPISFIVAVVDVAGSPLISIQEVVRGTFTSSDHFGNICSAQLCAICRAKNMMKATEMSSKKLINKIYCKVKKFLELVKEGAEFFRLCAINWELFPLTRVNEVIFLISSAWAQMNRAEWRVINGAAEHIHGVCEHVWQKQHVSNSQVP